MILSANASLSLWGVSSPWGGRDEYIIQRPGRCTPARQATASSSRPCGAYSFVTTAASHPVSAFGLTMRYESDG